MKYNTIEIEERRARNEAYCCCCQRRKWQWDEPCLWGMNLGQTLVSNCQQVQNQAPAQNTGANCQQEFYIEVDGKYVLVTKDEDGNISTSQLIKIL